MTKVRTRFSPSPTGRIHLGNARAALFSALYAAKNHGVFILRIEDTDVARSQEQYTEGLQDDLKWLDIHWQEGPGVGGDYGPYWQSQRQAVYDRFYQLLEEKNLVYPCFCTDQELLLSRKRQLSLGQPPRYAGTCLQLSAADIEARLQAGKEPAWRFKIPEHETITFEDLVKGPQQFKSDAIGDFIVRRADGTPPFLFCNAIDDATMEVTHVLRGEDHLTNTPRQIMILQALNLPIPQYGHLSLIVGDDGAPLSKRHGSFNIQDLRARGFIPEAIVNYLVRLGHSCDTQALLSVHDLAHHFSIDKLSRSPARFDLSQLMYWQKVAVQSLDNQIFWRWLGESIENQIPETMRPQFAAAIRGNIEFPADALMWARIFTHENVDIDPAELNIIREAGEQFFVEAEQAVDKYGTELSNVLADMKETLGVTGKKLFLPFRIALTGKTHGPELAQIAALLGQRKIKHRLGHAFRLASGG